MIPQEEEQFLSQGLKEYADATNAISAFRALVQGKFRRVVEENLKANAEALGFDLSKGRVKDYELSENGEHYLGVRYIREDSPYSEFAHTLHWWSDERGRWETNILMWVWSSRKNLDHLKKALLESAVVHDTEEDDEILWVGEQLPAADAAQIDRKLDAVMTRWIELWAKVGGIKALTGKSP